MFKWFKERMARRAAREEKEKQNGAVNLDEKFRQAQDNAWTGMSTDARRNHPGFGSAPHGAGRR